MQLSPNASCFLVHQPERNSLWFIQNDVEDRQLTEWNRFLPRMALSMGIYGIFEIAASAA